jgi:hypothetical protein
VTLRLGGHSCNREIVPRFHRAVCDHFTPGGLLPSGPCLPQRLAGPGPFFHTPQKTRSRNREDPREVPKSQPLPTLAPHLICGSVDICFAHLHTGRSETRSNHRSTFYRTALGVSTAFESSSQSAERHRSSLS